MKTPPISRKQFLRNAGLVSLGSLAGTAACVRQSTYADAEAFDRDTRHTWKMVTTWSPGFPVVGEGCNMFAEWVEQMSAGQLRIRVYGAGELVPAMEAFEAVSSGAADIGSGAAYYWAGKSAAAQFFAAVPYGLNAQQMNTWLYRGGGLELWEEVYAPFNLVPLAGGNTGMQMGGWFNREINSMADLKGLKMRIPGLGGKVLDRAGGTAVLSAGAEIFTNLERHVIDATEWIGPYHDYLMGFHRIAKYYYYPGWHEPGTTLEIFVNKLKFDSLPLHLQEIIRSAAARLNVWMLAEFEIRNAEYLEKIRNETQVQIRSFPPDVLDRLREISATVIEELGAADALSTRIYRSLMDFKALINTWSALTEKVFYDRF